MTTEQNTSIPTRKRGNQNNEKPSHYVGTIVILVSMVFKFIETILRMIR